MNHLFIRVDVVEAEPRKSGAQELMLRQQLRLHSPGVWQRHPQEALAVRAGTLASPPRLHAEQVVQKRAHKVVM